MTPRSLRRALARPDKIAPIIEDKEEIPEATQEELAAAAASFRRALFSCFAAHQFIALTLVSIFTLVGTFNGFWNFGMCCLFFSLMVGSLLLLFWFRFHPLMKWVLLVIFTFLQATFFCGVNWFYSTRCGLFAQLYLAVISVGIGHLTMLSEPRAAFYTWICVSAVSIALQPFVPAVSINSMVNLIGTLVFCALLACWFLLESRNLQRQHKDQPDSSSFHLMLFFYADFLIASGLGLVAFFVVLGMLMGLGCCMNSGKSRLPLEESMALEAMEEENRRRDSEDLLARKAERKHDKAVRDTGKMAVAVGRMSVVVEEGGGHAGVGRGGRGGRGGRVNRGSVMVPELNRQQSKGGAAAAAGLLRGVATSPSSKMPPV
jgi:hypothetical protein